MDTKIIDAVWEKIVALLPYKQEEAKELFDSLIAEIKESECEY